MTAWIALLFSVSLVASAAPAKKGPRPKPTPSPSATAEPAPVPKPTQQPGVVGEKQPETEFHSQGTSNNLHPAETAGPGGYRSGPDLPRG